MPRLSYHQISALVHFAKRKVSFDPPGQRSTRALRRKGLLVLGPDGRFAVTPHGEVALDEHGYRCDGAWRGSNQPRKYR